MATKTNVILYFRTVDGWEWVRKANNGALIARSHKAFATPGLAKKNVTATQAGPLEVHTVAEITRREVFA